MAGAAPEHFPVILVLASSGDTGRQSSMSSMGNMVVELNGPIRHEIGMNSGIGALGPYNYANSAIGRAFGLLSQNLQGGSVPGDDVQAARRAATSPTTASRSPRTRRQAPRSRTTSNTATDRDESAVTVSYIWGNVWAEYLRHVLGGEAPSRWSPGSSPGWACTLVLDPIVAREFCEKGLRHEGQARPVDPRERAHSAAPLRGPRDAEPQIHEEVESGVEPFAGYWKAPPDELIPVFEPDRINIVVAGGETNGHFSIFMGSPMRAKFRTNAGQKAAVSVDAWR